MPKFTVDENILRVEFADDDLSSPAAALQASIAKWKFVTAWIGRNSAYLSDGGCATCALCKYHKPFLYVDACGTCPVGAGCKHTPYTDYVRSYEAGWLASLVAAATEVKFLTRLLEGNGK